MVYVAHRLNFIDIGPMGNPVVDCDHQLRLIEYSSFRGENTRNNLSGTTSSHFQKDINVQVAHLLSDLYETA
jgi:hypothetical protein